MEIPQSLLYILIGYGTVSVIKDFYILYKLYITEKSKNKFDIGYKSTYID